MAFIESNVTHIREWHIGFDWFAYERALLYANVFPYISAWSRTVGNVSLSHLFIIALHWFNGKEELKHENVGQDLSPALHEGSEVENKSPEISDVDQYLPFNLVLTHRVIKLLKADV